VCRERGLIRSLDFTFLLKPFNFQPARIELKPNYSKPKCCKLKLSDSGLGLSNPNPNFSKFGF
jgi:hypothetical protein